MKTLLAVIVVMVALGGSLSFAAPFLVCDPTNEAVTEYEITWEGNPVPETTPALDLGDGTVRLNYDMAGVAEGNHSLTVRAANIWGASAPSNPFLFTKELPSVPSGMKLQQ